MTKPTIDSTNKVPRGRRTAPERVRTLNASGHVAKEAYLVAALRHLANVKTARGHSLAFKLFPARSAKAASAAVQRILGNARARNLVEYGTHPANQRRYYALTAKGAKFLAEAQPENGPVLKTTSALKTLRKAEHREWTSMIEASSNARVGLVGFDEFHLRGARGRELCERFPGFIPDALTFWSEHKIVFWHEVETSRRSRWTPAQQKTQEDAKWEWARRMAAELGVETRSLYRKPKSDTQRFCELIKDVREKRFFYYQGTGDTRQVEYEIVLILHCATKTIQAELARHIRATLGPETPLTSPDDSLFEMLFSPKNRSPGGMKFNIMLPLIAKDTREVWHDTNHLPFPNAPKEMHQELLERSDQFLAAPEATEAKTRGET